MRAEYIPHQQNGVKCTLKQYSDSIVGVFTTYFQDIHAILIVNDIVLAVENKSCGNTGT